MKKLTLPKWIGLSLLSVSLISGCRHCRCDDCCVVECGPSVALEGPEKSHYSPVVLPAPKVMVTEKPVAEPTITESAKPVVQPVVAQETKDDFESVLMTTMAPDASGQGTIGGTVSLTPAQAKAMGIRPGYTPGALAVPAKTRIVTNPPKVIEPAPTGSDVLPSFPPPPKDGE